MAYQIIRKVLPHAPIINFQKWRQYIKKNADTNLLEYEKVERPFTINATLLQKVVDAKALRN